MYKDVRGTRRLANMSMPLAHGGWLGLAREGTVWAHAGTRPEVAGEGRAGVEYRRRKRSIISRASQGTTPTLSTYNERTVACATRMRAISGQGKDKGKA